MLIQRSSYSDTYDSLSTSGWFMLTAGVSFTILNEGGLSKSVCSAASSIEVQCFKDMLQNTSLLLLMKHVNVLSLTIQLFIQFQMKENRIGHNPAKLLRTPKAPQKLPRVMTEEQVEYVCQAIRAVVSEA